MVVFADFVADSLQVVFQAKITFKDRFVNA